MKRFIPVRVRLDGFSYCGRAGAPGGAGYVPEYSPRGAVEQRPPAMAVARRPGPGATMPRRNGAHGARRGG